MLQQNLINMIHLLCARFHNNKCKVNSKQLKDIDKCCKSKIKVNNICNQNDNLQYDCNTKSKIY